MSALIKSAAAASRAQPFRSVSRSPSATAIEAVDQEAPLKERIAELEAELDRLAAHHKGELEDARREAAGQALEQRSDAEDKALDLLKDSLADLSRCWMERLQAWDSAAAGIAREALAKVFDEASTCGDAVASAIRARLSRLDASSLIRIRVSASDFPCGTGDIVAPGSGVEILADSSLASGQCLADLELGHADLSPGIQWTRIAELLDAAECEGTEP